MRDSRSGENRATDPAPRDVSLCVIHGRLEAGRRDSRRRGHGACRADPGPSRPLQPTALGRDEGGEAAERVCHDVRPVRFRDDVIRPTELGAEPLVAADDDATRNWALRETWFFVPPNTRRDADPRYNSPAFKPEEGLC